ncbi:heavy-metal-associated domain-containing protein [Lactobacillus corticis]|uniref:Copper chaperone n=1 Tax=Lactobacillus corticis TaxID=2201249 RepID=A0A916QJJ4_9LACO|nr:heavy-metal-associated domain-containing protein [Lactobacillus corticis]GFZ26455.1 copper chaperone [Lactobacillus corticis]
MKQATIQLGTLTCPSCMQKIQNAVKQLDGIQDVKVLFNSGKVKANYDDQKLATETIANTISQLGYEVKKTSVKEAN